jgi:hypothetical protein
MDTANDISADLIDDLVKQNILTPEVASRLLSSATKEEKAVAAAVPAIDEVAAKAADAGIGPEELVRKLSPAVVKQESGGRADAVSPKGAVGKMQLMPATAKEVAGKLKMDSYDLKNPDDNQRLGEEYLRQQIVKYQDPKLALAAYNAGPGRVDAALKKSGGKSFEEIESILPEETRNYVRSISASVGAPAEEPGMLAKAGNAVMDMLSSPVEAQESPDAFRPTPAPTPQAAIQPAAAPPEEAQPTPVFPAPQWARAGMSPTHGGALRADPSAEDLALYNTLAAKRVQQPQSPELLAAQRAPQLAIEQAAQTAQAGDAGATINNLAANQELDATRLQMQGAFGSQAAGLQQQGAALQQEADQESALFAQQRDELAAQATDYAAQRKTLQDAMKVDLDRFKQKTEEFSSLTIDPDRYFKNKSTFGKVLMIVGGIAAGLSGNADKAIARIQTAVDNDIAQQKAAIDLKRKDIVQRKGLLSANFSQLQDLNQAEIQTRAQIMARVKASVDQIAANTKNVQAQGALLEASGKLQESMGQYELDMQKASEEKHSVNLLNTLQGSQAQLSASEQQLMKLAAPGTKLADKLLQHEGKPVGLARDPKAWTDQIVWSTSMNDSLDRLEKMYREHGIEVFNTERAALMNKLIGDAHQAVVLGHEKGARGFSKFLTAQLEKELPTDMFGKNMIGRLGNQISRVKFDKVPMLIDEFRKKYNGVFQSRIRDEMYYRTPEFDKWSQSQIARSGLDPAVKKVK